MKNNGVTLERLILTLQQYLSHHLRVVSEHLGLREFILSALLKATILHSRDGTAATQTEERSVETDLLNSPGAASHRSSRPGSQCPAHPQLFFCQTGIPPDSHNNIEIWGMF